MNTGDTMDGFFNILSEVELHKIHAASLEAAAAVGMEMEAKSALHELADKGARVDFEKNRA